MNRIVRNSLLLANSLVSAAAPALPQAPSSPKTAPAANIFSGTVTSLTETSLVVVQKVLLRDPVTRQFTRTPETTVEGNVREQSRVTVRYKTGSEGELIAVHIIVR